MTTTTTQPEASSSAAGDSGRLGWAERIGYGMGDVGSCLYFTIFMSFLAFFYTDIYGISAAAVGTMLFVVRSYDWIKDPIMGVIADRTTSRHGRYRPWLIWMIAPYVVLGILTFTTFDLSPTAKLVYAYVSYIALTLVYTMINVPYSALMGVMTPNPGERTVLSSARQIGSAVAALFVYSTIFPLIDLFGQGDKQQGFMLTVALYAVLAAGAFLFTFFATRERLQPPRTADESVKRDLKLLLKNGPWLVLILISVLTIISMGVRAGTTVYYFKYVAGDETLAAGFLLIGSLTQIAAVSFTSNIASWFGSKRQAFLVLKIVSAFLGLTFYFIPPQNTVLIAAYQIAATAISAPLMALFWAMIADSASYGMWQLNQRSTGLLFSAGTFSQKIGWSLGPAMALWILGAVGFQANMQQSPETLFWMQMLMSAIPAGIALVAAAAVLLYKIDGPMEREIEAGLQSLRIAKASSQL